MIDFKELSEDGVKFEQLIRELLVLEGFNTHWTGVGQDGGRDLVVTETLKGELSEYKRKWLISCKHTANSGKSLGREQAGNITEDCRAIDAEGYIVVCSTQPTAGLITRLSEIEQNQGILTKFWDSIEIEKRLLKPNTFSLIHTFFPESSKSYLWKIYNAFSPAFWAANYKDYFFYMSCRLSNTYPDLGTIEDIIYRVEQIPLFKGSDTGFSDHYLRPRAIYFDEKHSEYIVYIDYIYPLDSDKKNIIPPKILHQLLRKSYLQDINDPIWDVAYIPEFIAGDHFDLDHKQYYEKYLRKFENGVPRVEFLEYY